MRVFIVLFLCIAVTPAFGQMDEDLTRRLREAQERLDRANATLRALPQPTNNQFNPDAVRRQDQESVAQQAREQAEKAAAQERARQEWERNRPVTTTCRQFGRGTTECTTR